MVASPVVVVVTAVVPRVVPVVMGDAAVVVPVESPTQPPTEYHPGAVSNDRFVNDHRPVDVDDLWVILGNIDDLRIRWLDADDFLLHDNDLLFVVGKHSLGTGFGTHQLDGIVDFFLLKVDGFPEGGGPIDVLRHHTDDIAELHERDHCRIPERDGFLWRLHHVRVLEQVLVRPNHIERAGRGRQDLGEQLVGIERDRRDQGFELLHRAFDVTGFIRIQLRHEGFPNCGRRGRWRRRGLRSGRNGKAGAGEQPQHGMDWSGQVGASAGMHG